MDRTKESGIGGLSSLPGSGALQKVAGYLA
jgi:hypothetical protein